MRVRITRGRQLLSIAGMWYNDRIGEEFDVIDDPIHEDMLVTKQEYKGEMIDHNIFKDDCEIVINTD
ncbi:hypothetical protein [Paenibacillus sp. HJGM_3]|uniref:hypothetical protein n=1 Tax=Paenibacillus sp. HJGM_3 TaxID=3379816 RepID=UPI00385C6A6B